MIPRWPPAVRASSWDIATFEVCDRRGNFLFVNQRQRRSRHDCRSHRVPRKPDRPGNPEPALMRRLTRRRRDGMTSTTTRHTGRQGRASSTAFPTGSPINREPSRNGQLPPITPGHRLNPHTRMQRSSAMASDEGSFESGDLWDQLASLRSQIEQLTEERIRPAVADAASQIKNQTDAPRGAGARPAACGGRHRLRARVPARAGDAIKRHPVTASRDSSPARPATTRRAGRRS